MEFNWEVAKKDRGLPIKTLILLSALSFAAAAYFLFNESYFAGALFIVMPIVVITSSINGPEVTETSISKNGVRVNKKLYTYEDLESFSIIQDDLILKREDEKTFYIPINMEDEDGIKNVLGNYIPEKEHEEGFLDMVNRFLQIH